MAQNTQRRSAMAGKGWYLVALLLFAQCVQANPYGDEDEDDDEDEELLVVGDANEGGSDERLESLHDAVGDAAPPPTPTSEIEDPLKNVIDAALNQPAIFAQRLKVNFDDGKVEEILLKRGDSPMQVVEEFAEEHGMEDDQAELTARALARAQLEGAYISEIDRRAVDDQALNKPALFNLSLAVKESDEEPEDGSLKVAILAGQSPMEATNAFVEASDTPISSEIARKIALKLLDDQRAVAWDVASEQFSENTTVLSYLKNRLVALNRAELESLQAAITARVSQLLLFTLYVECDGCADVDGLSPMPVRAHEGDNVEDLTNEAALLAVRSPLNRSVFRQGREDDELWVSRVRGAIIVTFHNYKQLREEVAAKEGREPTSANPQSFWYDQRTDSFKDPRAWEEIPPREPPLFQISYEVESPKSDGYPVNVTIYEGDIAIEIGERLSEYYEIAPSAGHSFAHYVATSFRKVRDQLNLTMGVRPWEKEVPDGMPLFRVNLAEVEGLDEEGVVVVHEGDGPKALAKAALRYYREQRAAHCVTDGSGKAGGLLNGAGVDENSDGICTGETPAAIKLKVTKLSGVITARFKKYFS